MTRFPMVEFMMTERKCVDTLEQLSTWQKENLFKLQCLVKASNIQHSVYYECGSKQFLAFNTESADIFLYLKYDAASFPVIKRIPWFKGVHKEILALCFDPLGAWLLCACADSSLYIIPALLLFDETYIGNTKWNVGDVTVFPVHSSFSRVTAIVWWYNVTKSSNTAIIGTEHGEIVFISLENGKQLGVIHVNGSITTLNVCRDENNESVALLITNKVKEQWRVLLEQYPCNSLSNHNNGESSNVVHSNNDTHHETRSFASPRSRLQGLISKKQLSIKNLAVFHQKLLETRIQDLGDLLRGNGPSNRKNISDVIHSEQHPEENLSTINPELLSKDIFLTPQCDKEGRQLYTCYHIISNHITVHRCDFSAVPLSVHKIFESYENILLTQKLFFVTDTSQKIVYIVSHRLSEAYMNEESNINLDYIIGYFAFNSDSEVIRAVYKITEVTDVTTRKLSEDIDSKYVLPEKLKNISVEVPFLDTCIIVTSHSIYKVDLRTSLLAMFMELILDRNQPEKAIKLASMFGMNILELLEYAGDILLSNNKLSQATESYKYAKCSFLKRILKFVSGGLTTEIVICLTNYLASPAATKLLISTRIHLSNLCTLIFVELTLRSYIECTTDGCKEFFKFFLSTNIFYDEILAINIAGLTCLWEIVYDLAAQRSLYGQMLRLLVTTISSTINNSKALPSDFLICLSEPNLMHAMLLNPDLANCHMNFVIDNLPDAKIFVLQRLVTLYDPTNPLLRPRLVECKARHRAVSYCSESSQNDSIDLTDNCNAADTLIEGIVETFLLVLLTLIHKKGLLNSHSMSMYNIQSLGLIKENICVPYNVDFKRRSLSAGFSHVALIRNSHVFTWGSSMQGCLGTGSSVLRYGSPYAIHFFQNMKIEVLSISCGHCHTLAVTNNGVYAWGANKYGQLGLGKLLDCSTPELVVSLAQEVIVDALAGQYHSVALTLDGRIFTWGWGVHGQLGHGNTDEKNTPTLVTTLFGVVIRQISAGYAHTLALSADGIVYAFGSNILGQLGIHINVKSTIPVKVLVSEKIALIATGYFHNLAVSHTNKLFVWGASPQVLKSRLKKNSRMSEQQDNTEKYKQNADEASGKQNSRAAVASNLEKEVVESDVPNKHQEGQATSRSTEIERKQVDSIIVKNINVEKTQAHLRPAIVDTSMVEDQIIQISTGCHHNALITKDGTLYTWGCNSHGQVGSSTKHEVPIPTPLCYNPASIFEHLPSRPSTVKRDSTDKDINDPKNLGFPEKNGNLIRTDQVSNDQTDSKKRTTHIIKSIRVCCGYDYTISIQPGGTVLAWGCNSRAQLGRIPTRDVNDGDEKFVSRKISRLPHIQQIWDLPIPIPNIPLPIISYQNYAVPCLAGAIQPLTAIEKSPGELTLHHALEYFTGMYDSAKIMEKCAELANYQGCSKIARLQHNICDAFSYDLKQLNSALKLQTFRDPMKDVNLINVSLSQHVKENTELFNKQVEKNLIESVEDCAAKIRMRIPTSKSLNSLQILEQELYSFDCQGGSEELCKDSKCEENYLELSEDALDNNSNAYNTEVWSEELMHDKDTQLEHKNDSDISLKNEEMYQNCGGNATNENILKQNLSLTDTVCENGISHSQNHDAINETIKVIKFYLNELEDETNSEKYTILQMLLEFWVEQSLPTDRLEHVLLEHIDTIFYPLGLLLFCEDIMNKYMDTNRKDMKKVIVHTKKMFSTKFCLQICFMIIQHINQGQSCPEYIKLLSFLTADHYGPPLIGYPGSTGNNTAEEMIQGIISTVTSESYKSRSFVNIKDTDAVSQFFAIEKDTMVFTCGHHFPFPTYKAGIISGMETELLTSQTLLLPCTAQFLGKYLSQNINPEIVCPICIPRALYAVVRGKTE